MAEIPPLYDKKFNCPICDSKFTSKKIRSRFIRLVSTDTDFCPTYTNPELNPLLYGIAVCPSCGFSYSDDNSSTFPPGTKEAIIENVCSKWNPQSFSNERTFKDAIKTYKLALYCSILKNEKHITLAGLCVKLAWLYRYLENNTQEQRFLEIALQEYLNSYMTGDYQGTLVSEIRILYLIGELSIRTGNVKEASIYFSRVIEKQRKTTETKIVEMAKERWGEIRQSKEFQLSMS